MLAMLNTPFNWVLTKLSDIFCSSHYHWLKSLLWLQCSYFFQHDINTKLIMLKMNLQEWSKVSEFIQKSEMKILKFFINERIDWNTHILCILFSFTLLEITMQQCCHDVLKSCSFVLQKTYIMHWSSLWPMLLCISMVYNLAQWETVFGRIPTRSLSKQLQNLSGKMASNVLTDSRKSIFVHVLGSCLELSSQPDLYLPSKMVWHLTTLSFLCFWVVCHMTEVCCTPMTHDW